MLLSDIGLSLDLPTAGQSAVTRALLPRTWRSGVGTNAWHAADDTQYVVGQLDQNDPGAFSLDVAHGFQNVLVPPRSLPSVGAVDQKPAGAVEEQTRGSLNGQPLILMEGSRELHHVVLPVTII